MEYRRFPERLWRDHSGRLARSGIPCTLHDSMSTSVISWGLSALQPRDVSTQFQLSKALSAYHICVLRARLCSSANVSGSLSFHTAGGFYAARVGQRPQTLSEQCRTWPVKYVNLQVSSLCVDPGQNGSLAFNATGFWPESHVTSMSISLATARYKGLG